MSLWYLVRDGLKIKQSEWNIVKIGNSAHAGKCIKARYKNIRMETIDNNSPRTILIMSNGLIDVSCSGLYQTRNLTLPGKSWKTHPENFPKYQFSGTRH